MYPSKPLRPIVKSISTTLSTKFDLQHTIPFEFTLAANPSATDGALSIAEQRQALGAEQDHGNED